MNIGFICSEYPPASHGGIGSVTQILGRALATRGHKVRVIGVYPSTVTAPEYQDDQGVQVRRLTMGGARLGWVAARYELYREVAAWAKEGSIDLLEVPDWEGWVAGWPKLPVPVIARLHGSSCYFAAELQNPSKRRTFWIERAALRRSDYWCSVSRYTAEKTRELFALENGPGTVIYNAVDLPAQISPVPRVRGDVVFSGTLTAKKGIVSLVKAWPLVKKQCPEAKLHIYGKDTTDPAKPAMRDILSKMLPDGDRESVIFHGHVGREMVLAHLRQARVAVFPSHAEAFAMAPLEAMSQGCPTVYSDKGSGPEVIEDGKDGLLVDPTNSDDIARLIVRVLHDDSLAEQLGTAGCKKIERSFSTGHIVPRNEAFYADCLNRFHQGSRN